MAVINIKDIANVRYQAPDLDAMEAFLIDFGMTRAERSDTALYMKGCGSAPFIHVTEKGPEPKCVGIGFYAQNASDLDKLADYLGCQVEDSAEPGNGKVVNFEDPDGFKISVLFGQQQVEPVVVREPIALNPNINRARFGKTVRNEVTASHIMRIGHIAILVSDFKKTLEFYQDVLGLLPSDTYYAESSENIVAAFMRCGLGDTFTDHHTMALITAPDGVARFDHSAFEVIDLDDLMLGNQYLLDKQHVHSWGIGRHVEGSQLFDYWRDPFGNKLEHWTDGDLVNDSTPVGNAEVNPEALSQWAPPLHPDFFL